MRTLRFTFSGHSETFGTLFEAVEGHAASCIDGRAFQVVAFGHTKVLHYHLAVSQSFHLKRVASLVPARRPVVVMAHPDDGTISQRGRRRTVSRRADGPAIQLNRRPHRPL